MGLTSHLYIIKACGPGSSESITDCTSCLSEISPLVFLFFEVDFLVWASQNLEGLFSMNAEGN